MNYEVIRTVVAFPCKSRPTMAAPSACHGPGLDPGNRELLEVLLAACLGRPDVAPADAGYD